MKRHSSSKNYFLILALLALVLVACGTPTAKTPTPALQITVVTAIPAQTSTSLPGKVILVLPASFTGDFNTLQAAVGSLASGSGLQFESRQALQPADIQPDWKVVVLLEVPSNLADLLSANPHTQFLLVTSQDVSVSPNLTVIRLDQPEKAFVAGYIAELVADDWRAAGLFPEDDPQSGLITQAFVNGGNYWCGTCSPSHPPYVYFPLTSVIPSNSDWTAWQTAADQLITNRLALIYVSVAANNPDLLKYLAGEGILLIGGSAPASNVLGNWVATIDWNIPQAITDHWTGVVSGQGGMVYDAPIVLADVNEEFLTVGRQRLVEEVVTALQQGLINPLDIP